KKLFVWPIDKLEIKSRMLIKNIRPIGLLFIVQKTTKTSFYRSKIIQIFQRRPDERTLITPHPNNFLIKPLNPTSNCHPINQQNSQQRGDGHQNAKQAEAF